MAKVVKLKSGLNLCLAGAAAPKVEKTVVSDTVAIVPDNYHGVVPKVVVKPGDKVQVGTSVMYDKNHPEVQFVSPVSGEVVAVERGERRKVMKIVIKSDGKSDAVVFDKASSAVEVKELLLRAGMWAYIKQRPYDVIADPTVEPRDIFITAFDNAPLAPAYAYEMLNGDDAKALAEGLAALKLLTQGKVYVGVAAGSNLNVPAGVEVVAFKGNFPACNAGVQAHNIAPVNKGETIWTLNALDVVVMGRLLLNGRVDMMRTVAVTGSEVATPAYVRALPGTPMADLLAGNIIAGDYARRVISGNVLTGTNVSLDGYLGAYHSQVTVIPEGNDTHEFLGWALPGCKALTTSRTFLSRWIPTRNSKPDARLHGGERAIIMSEEYDRVFPMDILPEYLVKAVIAFDIDRMEQLGIYEVAPEDFAACEFVDTSKLPLQQIVRDGLDALRKEMN
ncbi:MAG: Na(+)-translocating NADH-quinone reductase subunit A [Bacteroidaceae bacterium]|nr:Na(+)-translocating NADH-quinone reductase subunit A [Bacteroidaceae bacterium]